MTFFEAIRELKRTNELEGDIEQQEGNQKNDIITTHSRDASVFVVEPEMVFFPKHKKDIQTILQVAQNFKDQKISISVRAGGTCMDGGSLTNGLIINLTKYMHDVQIDPLAQTAYVQMGAMFSAVAKGAGEHNLLFGAYTSSKDICGIGGMIGNNASGEKSVRLGATIDNVLGLEVILFDGTIIRTGALENTGEQLAGILRETTLKKDLKQIHDDIIDDLRNAIGEVSKCASGYRLEHLYTSPFCQKQTALREFEKTITGGSLSFEQDTTEAPVLDLTPVFVGAQGTLGIVTEALLALQPIPTYTRLLVISIDTLKELPFVLQSVMRFHPEGVETFDIHTFEKAKNLLSHETEVCQQFFTDTTNLVVLAQLSEDTKEHTDAVAREVESLLHTHSIRVTYVEDADIEQSIWKIRRSSFSVMRDFNEPGKFAVPCIEDIIVPISHFDRLIPALEVLIDKYQISYGFHGHIGDGSIRIIPIFDFSVGSEQVATTIIDFTREAIALVKTLKGNMSADHSDGIIRTPFIREFYGDRVFEAFVKTKLLFDPHGILNRGKKIGGTEEAIKKYIIKG